jgi:hypothetical protein
MEASKPQGDAAVAVVAGVAGVAVSAQALRVRLCLMKQTPKRPMQNLQQKL